MNLFQTIVGIDPSNRRLSLAAVRGRVGRPALCAPPFVCELRGERDQQLLSEAEEVLGDFVARNGLEGSAARLCVPADRVYTARISFPPIREKDLRPALELELERLFPFPPSRLRFGWRRLPKPVDGKDVALIVTAAPADYIEWWENAVSRAGLRPAGAIPVGWALSAALSGPDGLRKGTGRLVGILREARDAVECNVLQDDVPVFSALRRFPAGETAAEGISLLEEGLVDAPPPDADAPVELVSPLGWWAGDGEEGGRAGGSAIRHVGDFPYPEAVFPGDRGNQEEGIPAGRIAGAFGAAVAFRAIDLSARGSDASSSRLDRVIVRTLAIAAVLLALAWPATHYFRTKAELSRLDAEIAAVTPAVAGVEKRVADLTRIERKIALLHEAASVRGEPLLIVKELTERLPDGTWLTGLRLDGRKVEIDGLSPSANEIFPLLARDGRFRNVAFASPITRQGDNRERFRIGAEFVPAPGPVAGQGAR